MINTVGEVVAAGFVSGTVAGTVIFLFNLAISSAMNIFKFP